MPPVLAAVRGLGRGVEDLLVTWGVCLIWIPCVLITLLRQGGGLMSVVFFRRWGRRLVFFVHHRGLRTKGLP